MRGLSRALVVFFIVFGVIAATLLCWHSDYAAEIVFGGLIVLAPLFVVMLNLDAARGEWDELPASVVSTFGSHIVDS